MRSHHGNQATLAKIIKRFGDDWDRKWVDSEGDEATHDTHYRGYFYPMDAGSGKPRMSVIAIGLNLIFLTALEHLGSRKKASRFIQNNLFEILLLIENPCDSICDSISLEFGYSGSRERRIEDMASIMYGWVLRQTRPWWKSPMFHIHHWRLQIHPLQNLKRKFWDKCCKCGKRGFKSNDAIGDWNGTRIWHGHCDDSAKQPTTTN